MSKRLNVLVGDLIVIVLAGVGAIMFNLIGACVGGVIGVIMAEYFIWDRKKW